MQEGDQSFGLEMGEKGWIRLCHQLRKMNLSLLICEMGM